MFKRLVFFLHTLLCLFLAQQSKAQGIMTAAHKLELGKFQDTLKTLSDSSFATLSDQNKLKYNTEFSKKLITALKIPFSYYYDFDSLKNVSFVKSQDGGFRLITWFLPLSNGTYQFYGSIQFRMANNQLKLLPLTDYTINLLDVNAITNREKWYGARYYDMIPVNSAGKPSYFILLGWKGNNDKTSKKVIEVLSFEKGEPIFGKNIFETEKNGPLKNRIIFEYNKQNNMSLFYDKSRNSIVFDHLAPFDRDMKGNFEYYGSDLTFDAYVISYNKLKLKEDIDLKNEAVATDEMYIPPTKASSIKLSRQ